jgi:hypothetical protein
VVDELHDDNLPLNAQQHLVCPRASFRHRKARRDDLSFGDNLDGGVFASDGMFGDFDATWRLAQTQPYPNHDNRDGLLT